MFYTNMVIELEPQNGNLNSGFYLLYYIEQNV